MYSIILQLLFYIKGNIQLIILIFVWMYIYKEMYISGGISNDMQFCMILELFYSTLNDFPPLNPQLEAYVFLHPRTTLHTIAFYLLFISH